MRESDFQAEITRSIPWVESQLTEKIHYCKIPDMPKGPEQRFLARKGYDCFLVFRGQHLAMELKLSKSVSFAFDKVDEYQYAMLSENEASGGGSFLLVCFRANFSTREATKRGTPKIIQAFAVPLCMYETARMEATRASLPLEWFETHALTLPKIRVGGQLGWDLRPLLALQAIKHCGFKLALEASKN